MSKKIAFVASECQPFFASGGLGDVIGSLPSRIVKEGADDLEVSVFLPLYSSMTAGYRNKLVYVGQIDVQLSWRKQYCGIYKYENKGVSYYFIDNEYYFKRNSFYGYYDDAERFAFFSKAVIDVMLFLNEVPSIIHTHDWQTALVSIYLRTLYYNYPEFKDVKTIFTIHNIEYQGKYSFDEDIISDVFGISMFNADILEYRGTINLMKGAMEAANYVTTVSPSYAEEILTPEYAHGLEYEVRRVKEEGKLVGILNGIDKNFYNPLKDKALFANYNRKDFSNKVVNKVELQKMLNLPVDENIPLIGMVTRLVAHKGLDIVKDALESILNEKVQFVVLGTGDSYYEGFFKDMEYKYGNKLKTIVAFNQDLSRKIYAASDIFLMPSKSEPCGLAQMIASRYGSIPLVRETGGLKDSIKDFNTGKGNGYTFAGFEGHVLYETVHRALTDYEDIEEWYEKVKKVMSVDFGWSASAKVYVKLYKKILDK